MTAQMAYIILIIYGFMRLAYATAVLVGLSGGYFLKELILSYPSGASAFLFDQEFLTIIYFAIIFRTFFHFVLGVLLLRLNSFAKVWLYVGWPLVLFSNLSIGYIYFHQWQADGMLTSVSQVFFWPGLSIYMLASLIDIFFVQSLFFKLEKDENYHVQRVNFGIIGGVFVVSFLITSFILFLGNNVRQGFHEGFYKTKAAKEERSSVAVSTHTSKDEVKNKLTTQDDEIFPSKIVVKQESQQLSVVAQENAPAVYKIDKQQPNTTTKSYSYQQVLGWTAVVFILASLVFRFKEEKKIAEVILGFAFLLLCLYGILLKLWPVVVVSIVQILTLIVLIINKDSP